MNYWVHNGYLMVEGKKMSKSLGNFLLVHDLVKEHPPEALRLVLLSAHYRQPFDFTNEGVAAAKKTLDRYYGILRDNADVEDITVDAPPAFLEALLDDLNTPRALAELAAAAKKLSSAGTNHKEQAKAELRAAGALLGLLQQDPESWFKAMPTDVGIGAGEIESLIEARNAARKAKDFNEADRIRAELEAKGILIEDSAEGTKWRTA